MGTKLQHAINPLAVHRSIQLGAYQDCFPEERLSSDNYIRRRPVDNYKFQDSGNTMLEHHQLESIKKTMLMHEDIFKHQVRELHRLYSVQKKLMNDLRNDTKQTSQCGARACLDISNPGLGALMGFDFRRPGEEEMSSGVSSVIEENLTEPPEVELTLGIGPSTGKRRTAQSRLGLNGGGSSGAAMKSGKGKECSDHDSNSLFNQESKRPHWLFQDLSLNRT